mmetsp:Transcript_9068/g.23711  ORF Transcript_9068/g.23711 Transcript_9068/m.23711 type:complete len:195 (+) Transcript_9068:55-639(+)
MAASIGGLSSTLRKRPAAALGQPAPKRRQAELSDASSHEAQDARDGSASGEETPQPRTKEKRPVPRAKATAWKEHNARAGARMDDGLRNEGIMNLFPEAMIVPHRGRRKVEDQLAIVPVPRPPPRAPRPRAPRVQRKYSLFCAICGFRYVADEDAYAAYSSEGALTCAVVNPEFACRPGTKWFKSKGKYYLVEA